MRARVVRPVRKTLVRRIEQPGQIEAYAKTPVFAKVSGYVRRVLVDIGDHVNGPKFDESGKLTHTAQVLAELWAPEIEEAWKQKQAVVAQTAVLRSSRLRRRSVSPRPLCFGRIRGRPRPGRSAARTTAPSERWQSQFQRMTELAASKSIEPKLVEETQEQLRGAQAAFESTEARTEGAPVQVAARPVERRPGPEA